MASNWRDDYMASLRQVEASNPVNMELMDKCTKLADELAALKAEMALTQQTAAPPTASPVAGKGKEASPAPTPTDEASEDLAAKRALALALQSQGRWEARARAAEAECTRLKEVTRSRAREINKFTAANKTLTTKLNDRNDELRGKQKFASDLQDEIVALNMQLNIAERERDKIKSERQEIIDRWMRAKGAEADNMNRSNEAAALFEKGR